MNIDLLPKDAINESAKVYSRNSSNFELTVLWATWCESCVKDIPGLPLLQAEHPKLMIQTIAVLCDRSTVEDYVKQHSDFPIPIFHSTATEDQLKISGTPTHILRNDKNEIIWREVGLIEWNTDDAKKKFKSAMEGKLKNQTTGFTWIDQKGWEAITSANPNAIMIDVRTDDEWKSGHIQGAIHIPLAKFKTDYSKIPKGNPILLYCRSGNRSTHAANILVEKGYSQLYNLENGLQNWKGTLVK